MLGSEPALTGSTSLPSSSAWDLGLPRRMPEQDSLQWICSKYQLPAKDSKFPVNPTEVLLPTSP